MKELCEFGSYDNDSQKEIIAKEYPAWELSLGDPNRQLSQEELLNRDYYRGRFASKIKSKTVNNWDEV